MTEPTIKDVQRAVIVRKADGAFVALFSNKRKAEEAFYRLYNRSALFTVRHVPEDRYETMRSVIEGLMK